MKKTKKIVFVLIIIVALCATFVMSASAYLVEEGTSQISDVYVPNLSTSVDLSGGTRLTSTGFSKPLEDTFYYQGGDAFNSVRVTVVNEEEAYYQDWNVNGQLHTSAQSGRITYYMVSQNDFTFYMDMGDTLGAITSRFYPELTYGDNITPTLHISAMVGHFTDINSSGIAYGQYQSLQAFDDFSVEVNYRDPIEYYTSFLNRGDTERYFYNIYDGTDTQSVQSVNGFIENPMEDGSGYVMVAIMISTYKGADFPNTPSYFDNINTTVSRMSHKYNDYVYDLAYEAGSLSGESTLEAYNRGYDKGYEKGYDEGYDDGLDVSYDEGYDEGYDDGYGQTIEEMGFFAFIMDSIEALFDFPLFDLPGGGHISLGLLLGVIVGALVFVWILKLIAGG